MQEMAVLEGPDFKIFQGNKPPDPPSGSRLPALGPLFTDFLDPPLPLNRVSPLFIHREMPYLTTWITFCGGIDIPILIQSVPVWTTELLVERNMRNRTWSKWNSTLSSVYSSPTTSPVWPEITNFRTGCVALSVWCHMSTSRNLFNFLRQIQQPF